MKLALPFRITRPSFYLLQFGITALALQKSVKKLKLPQKQKVHKSRDSIKNLHPTYYYKLQFVEDDNYKLQPAQ